MRDTLEDLYFGKITPNEQDITPGSVLANAMDQAEQCEEKLADRLEGEEKTCGSSTRRTKSAAQWPWKILSWDFAWGCG
mgnify:CR=1 FL=1